MRIKPKYIERVLWGFVAKVCLMIFLSISLFGQTSDASRIGVCNVATELKPIEIESDVPNRSIAYSNLTEAFNAINEGIHTGEINVEVCFDSIEKESAILNSVENAFVKYSKLSIRPLKDNLTISSKTGFNALIALNGSDNVTIDGDNPNSAGENRNLTIYGWGGRSIIALQTEQYLYQNSKSIYNNASNNTLKNLNIYGKATPSYGIAMGGHNPGSSGISNNNNAIINCEFRNVRTGIFSGGKSPEMPNTGTIISKNDLTATGDERVRLVGIQLEYESNAVITENLIGGLKGVSGDIQDEVGILLGGGKMAGMANSCTANCYRSVSNSLVARNIISGIVGGERQSVAGIYIYGYKNAPNTIQNNVITGVIGSGLTPNIIVGIFVAGQNSSKTLVYNNSVSMTGEYGSDKIHNPSYAIVFWGEDTSVLIFNNIFSNTQTAANNPWAKSFAMGFVAQASSRNKSPFDFMESNNNIYYSNGSNVGFIRTRSLQRQKGLDIESLSEWQKLSKNDSDSLATDPLFIDSSNDLHLQAKSPAINAGVNIKSINAGLSALDRIIENDRTSAKKNDSPKKQKTDIGAYIWKP